MQPCLHLRLRPPNASSSELLIEVGILMEGLGLPAHVKMVASYDSKTLQSQVLLLMLMRIHQQIHGS